MIVCPILHAGIGRTPSWLFWGKTHLEAKDGVADQPPGRHQSAFRTLRRQHRRPSIRLTNASRATLSHMAPSLDLSASACVLWGSGVVERYRLWLDAAASALSRL